MQHKTPQCTYILLLNAINNVFCGLICLKIRFCWIYMCFFNYVLFVLFVFEIDGILNMVRRYNY